MYLKIVSHVPEDGFSYNRLIEADHFVWRYCDEWPDNYLCIPYLRSRYSVDVEAVVEKLRTKAPEGTKIEEPDPENPGQFIEVDPIVNVIGEYEGDNIPDQAWVVEVWKDQAFAWGLVVFVGNGYIMNEAGKTIDRF